MPFSFLNPLGSANRAAKELADVLKDEVIRANLPQLSQKAQTLFSDLDSAANEFNVQTKLVGTTANQLGEKLIQFIDDLQSYLIEIKKQTPEFIQKFNLLLKLFEKLLTTIQEDFHLTSESLNFAISEYAELAKDFRREFKSTVSIMRTGLLMTTFAFGGSFWFLWSRNDNDSIKALSLPTFCFSMAVIFTTIFIAQALQLNFVNNAITNITTAFYDQMRFFTNIFSIKRKAEKSARTNERLTRLVFSLTHQIHQLRRKEEAGQRSNEVLIKFEEISNRCEGLEKDLLNLRESDQRHQKIEPKIASLNTQVQGIITYLGLIKNVIVTLHTNHHGGDPYPVHQLKQNKFI